MKTQTPLPRILIVDDEPAMRRSLRLGLSPDGYVVSETDRGTGALEAVRRRDTDLIVLDLGLLDVDGLEVIKRIRYAQSDVPIIVLSNRGDEGAKVAALDLGADDYVTKPFGIEELLARIRVLQRHRVQPATDQSVVIEAGALRIHLVHRTATIRGTEVRLSPREFTLLQLLATHAGKVLTHSFILRHVWGIGTDVQYLRIYIRALRQKLEQEPERPTLLVTEPGVGYRLRVPDPGESAALLGRGSGSTLAPERTLSR
jgi:two-component system, OmpR family, KDP operon response regulator KdpE